MIHGNQIKMYLWREYRHMIFSKIGMKSMISCFVNFAINRVWSENSIIKNRIIPKIINENWSPQSFILSFSLKLAVLNIFR